MLNKIKLLVICSVSLFALSACGQTELIVPDFTASETQTVSQSAVSSKTQFNSAKDQFWRVQMDARNWDMSAELVKVIGREIKEDGSCNNWWYYFKSPFKRNVLVVTGWGSSHEEPNNGFYGSDISEFDWRVDSDKAIELAKKQGLNRFPVIDMTLESKFMNPEWELRTYNGIFRIDAETSKIMSAKSLNK